MKSYLLWIIKENDYKIKKLNTRRPKTRSKILKDSEKMTKNTQFDFLDYTDVIF